MGDADREGRVGLAPAMTAIPALTPVQRAFNGFRRRTSIGLVLIGADLRVDWISPSVADAAGFEAARVVGTPIFDLLHPDDAASVASALESRAAPASRDREAGVAHMEPIIANDVRVLTSDGWRTVEVLASDLRDDPEVAGIVVEVRLVERRRAEDETLELLASAAPIDDVLASVVALVRHLIPFAQVAIAHQEHAAVEHFAGSRAADGSRAGDVVEEADRLRPTIIGDGEAGEGVLRAYRYVRRTGDKLVHVDAASGHAVWALPATTEEGDVGAVLFMLVPRPVQPDAWTLKALHRATRLASLAVNRHRQDTSVRQAAAIDPLTGVTNRASFFAQLDHPQRNRRRSLWAMFYVDIDEFKKVNEEHGHAIGDCVLIEVARRMSRAARAGDIVARIGGDEFTLLCSDVDDERTAEIIANRLVEVLSAPMTVAGVTLSVGASVGMAFTRGASDVASLLEGSDLALLEAKRSGKGRWSAAPQEV